jgi:uncharacterized membrane protein YoaK (UPF0700 family)
MARSFLGALASALFKSARTTSNAHLAESILTGNVKSVERSVKTRARNKAKTALWRAVTGKKMRW